MKKMPFGLFFCFATLLILIPSLNAQAVYTANQNTRIQVGAGAAFIAPDYSKGTLIGFSAWGDYDFSKYIGLEVSAHFGEIITPGDIAENSYMLGPRFSYRRRKLTLYAKALVGRATITNQDFNLSSSFNLYAFGGGVEYRILHKINLRLVDFEQQEWPSFMPNSLSPTAATIGVSYIIH